MPMWGYGYGMGGAVWVLGMLTCLFVFGLLIWGMLSLIERRTQRNLTLDQPPNALETLRQRYARGEIDEPTYQRMQEQLMARAPTAPPTPVG